jgi:ACS family hexuronate transporter-like MFS transporter
MVSEQKTTAGLRVWWPAIVMALGTLLSFLDRQVLALLSPLILRDTHMSGQDYGVVVSFFSFAYMLSTPIWGSLLDRIGLRLGLTISIAIWAVASASHSLVFTFWGFALARAALGLGEGSMFPAGFRTATDSLPPDKQARGVGIALAYGWRTAFLVTPLAAVVWWIVFRLTVNPDKFAFQTVHATKLSFPNVRERRFWSLVASYAMGALPVGAITYLAALYLSRAFGMSQKEIGMVLWIPPAGLEAGYFFWGWVSDRFAHDNPRPLWLFALLSVLTLPCAAISFFPSAAAALALLTVTMFGSAGFIIVSLRTGAMAYPKAQQGMAAGIASSSWSALVALLLPFLGHLFDAHLYSRAFVLVAFAPMVGTLLWAALTRPKTVR